MRNIILTLAAVSMLTTALKAAGLYSSTIVYDNTIYHANGNGSFDIAIGGTNYFHFYSTQYTGFGKTQLSYQNSGMSIDGGTGNYGSQQVLRLTLGDTIDGSRSYGTSDVLSWYNYGGKAGYFMDTPGYIGVSFNLGGQTNYGWISYSGSDSGASMTVNGFAYESSGGAIAAGAVPEPSTYALFGLAAIGILMVMMRKTA